MKQQAKIKLKTHNRNVKTHRETDINTSFTQNINLSTLSHMLSPNYSHVHMPLDDCASGINLFPKRKISFLLSQLYDKCLREITLLRRRN